jgi:hypothetical protein
MKKITRRRFMKNSMLLGTAITAFPAILSAKIKNASAASRFVFHPGVDNLRVVSITDPMMTTDSKPICDWKQQNELVNPQVVYANIDKLACALAETNDTTMAWKTIFLKPPRKSWSNTTVAIKTNTIAYQHTRSAVMAKICHTLTGTLGVAPHNIHIYDAGHGGNMHKKTPFADLPIGCRVEGKWGGFTTEVSVPEPWKGGGERSRCIKHLANGTVDILINIAMCKGHNIKFGGFSMTMKNHLGTFYPQPIHQGGGVDYLFAVNKTPEILGNVDTQTGKILYPRQQLCLIDALWASKRGPGGLPSHQPNFLAMGVSSPVLDYLVATRFRGERMGWKPNMKVANRMLTDFGHKKTDLPNGGRLIEI